ncbi:MAG: hypothetical protein K2P49_08940 [Oscillospiraceae bacterium]|nr:hypothetical protein [Oscillospiraceae bacterium]
MKHSCPPFPSSTFKEGLIKSTRAICEGFFATARRDFAGIIVFISRNHNEAVAEKTRKAPQAHLISASLSNSIIGLFPLKSNCFSAGTALYGSVFKCGNFLVDKSPVVW